MDRTLPVGNEGQEGYALVAAVASIAVFAAMALAFLSATRSVIADAATEQDQLQVSAAADAGVATALSKLLSNDATQRWSMDGRVYRLRYGDARIRVRLEDERGKVPINGIDEALATRLLEEVGLDGDRLLIARDSFLDWTDSDDFPRPFGAERAYYASAGIAPANGFLRSVDELRFVRGFDPETVQRIKAIASTYAPMGSFDPRFASARAMAIMEKGGSLGGPAAIDRARELAGQRTAIAFTDASDLTGRPVTIIVEASLSDGAKTSRTTVIQLTGTNDMPYVIMASD